MSKPVFAVVGHPNKGKSSIVATLTRQDAVMISEISGTTTQAQSFELKVDDVTHYTLIDTPGFQRPRQVLAWLQQHAANAADRKRAVQSFLHNELANEQTKYHDECELLTPILNGAGIIYVVDGSVPYTPEYEAEMSILQWTGQPRMALINPIGGEAHIQDWQSALSQYFSVVRVFDPMTADRQKQYTILSAFSELHEPWRQSIDETVRYLEEYFNRIERQGAIVVSESLIKMLSHISEVNVPVDFVQDILHEKLKSDYQHAIRSIELSMQKQLQALFAHPQMRYQGQSLVAEYPDLFDTSQWFMYGLDRQRIVGLSTSAGAAAGAVIDVGVGGASLMTGALAGGVLSGVASFIATRKPDKLKIKGVPIAGTTLTAGPVRELTFAYVLLGRALDFFEMILNRTHADRSVAETKAVSFTQRLNSLSKIDQIQLTQCLQKAYKGLNQKDLLKLTEWILSLSKSVE